MSNDVEAFLHRLDKNLEVLMDKVDRMGGAQAGQQTDVKALQAICSQLRALQAAEKAHREALVRQMQDLMRRHERLVWGITTALLTALTGIVLTLFR